ncbi:MAG: chloride channel protein [Clostridia bacterium]|nr:chloride channel protein [Clostridia bacterium]
MKEKHFRTTSDARIAETAVLIGALAKWVLLGALTGVVAGAGVVAFLKLLHGGIEIGAHIGLWWLTLPVGGLISAALIHYVSPESYGHGTEAVIRAVNRKGGKIPILVAPVKAAATIIAISCGASAGKEGPSAQIAGSLASQVARLLRLGADDHRRLTMCGLAAGFGVVTGAPISGAVFAVEALVMGSPFYGGLLPAAVASCTSVITARALGWDHPLAVNIVAPALSPSVILLVAACAMAIGLVSMVFIEAEEHSAHLFHQIPVSPPVRTSIGGVCLVLLALLFSRGYLGLGVEMYEETLQGGAVSTWAFALKMLFVVITLGSGFSGGAMTPIFAIGAAAGSSIGRLAGFDPAFSAAMGIAAFLAASVNAPLAASVLSLEAFGSAFGVYGFVAAIVAYTVVGHRSINATQLLGSPKSSAFSVDAGHECEAPGHVRFTPQAKRMFAFLMRSRPSEDHSSEAGQRH